MRILAGILILVFSIESVAAQIASGVVPYEQIQPAELKEIRPSCQSDAECANAHAVIFIHGIYGDEKTFSSVVPAANGAAAQRIDWPALIPQNIAGTRIDVYTIKYQTHLLAWLKKNISTLDEVVYGVFKAMDRKVLDKKYKSIGLIAHSLGGNVATSYLHTVKTERGHEERARHAYIITLGTPTDGADIAIVGLWAKDLFLMPDPLLKSLATDNTFLRMLAYWRYSEDSKARRFMCRPVSFYAGLEGAKMDGIQVVSKESAEFMRQGGFVKAEYKTFEGLNHSAIAQPPGNKDVMAWVDGILSKEIARVNSPRASGKLCRKLY